jgi:hypothetical protein
MKRASILTAAIIAWAGISLAQTITVNTSVQGNQGPWVSTSGLNSAYPYDFNSYTPPTVVSGSSGISFSAGSSLTIRYETGSVSIGTGWAYTRCEWRSEF